jgi:hypothetical protein
MKRLIWLALLLSPGANAAEVLGLNVPTTDPGAEVCQELPITGTYYIRATAWDAEGNQSALSNEVLKTFPDANPVCWQNPAENVDATPLTDLTQVTLYYSTEPITGGSTDQQAPLPTPIDLVGTVPEEQTVTIPIPYVPLGDLTLTMTVNDADIAGEGFIRSGSWEVSLFDGQLGPDAADHNVEYSIPGSAIQDCELQLTFGHVTTAGYRVLSGQVNYEAAASCEIPPPILPGLGTPSQDGSESASGPTLIGVTGSPVTLPYVEAGAVEWELVEYGGSVATLSGAASDGTITFTPPRAGLFFVRIRVAGEEWATGPDDQLFFFKLAAPSGGGIN